MIRLGEEQVYSGLAQRVKARRDTLGITQQQLADRVGLTRTSITNVEQGRQKIQVHTLYAIAAALDIEPALLLPTQQDLVPSTIDERLFIDLCAEEVDFARRVIARRRGASNE